MNSLPVVLLFVVMNYDFVGHCGLDLVFFYRMWDVMLNNEMVMFFYVDYINRLKFLLDYGNG